MSININAFMGKKMVKNIWNGSKYSRGSNARDGYRDRHSGIVYRDVKKVGNRYVGIGKIGIEPTRASPYGKNPRSKVQSIKDLRSFHQKIPARLRR